MGRCTDISLEAIPVCILVGTALGFLSGLGIGGGSLLILYLTAVLGMDQRLSQGINLLFFLPAAAVSCLFHFRQGRIDCPAALRAAGAGCVAAGLCAWAATALDIHILRSCFGMLLIITGLYELFSRRK